MQPESPHHLFVYGTLRRGADNDMHRLLARHARHVGVAWFQGQLFRVSDYPGAIASDDPADQIVGDLYELPPDGALLAALDEYEGCSARFAPPQEYVRVRRNVRTGQDAVVQAWIYLYQHPVSDLERVVGGDFLAVSPGSTARAQAAVPR